MKPRMSFFMIGLAGTLMMGGACQMMAPEPMEKPTLPAKMEQSALGVVWTDAMGMTLYIFDKDASGKSNCNGKCAKAWPPLLASASAQSMGDFTIVARDDDTRQWAYKGQPVYSWVKDKKPGDTTGNSVGDVWWVARPSPANRGPSAKGGFWTDAKGMTLYIFDKDASGKSKCNGKCAKAWPPFHASANAQSMGDFTIVARDDDTKQWAYKEQPVYSWVKDKKPGDTTGDGVGGVWHVAMP